MATAGAGAAPWAPNPEVFQAVVHMLMCVLAPDTALQREAHTAMDAYRSQPALEFMRYLSLILIQGGSLGNPALQEAAGMALRVAVESDWPGRVDEATRAHVKSHMLHALVLPTRKLRNTGGNIIATIARKEGLEGWPQLLQVLTQCLESDDPAMVGTAVEGALHTLALLAEDVAASFDSEALATAMRQTLGLPTLETPLHRIVPRLIHWLTASAPGSPARVDALKSLDNFTFHQSSALVVNMRAFVAALSAVTTDAAPAIRLGVVSAFSSLAGQALVHVWDFMPSIIEFMLSTCAAEGAAGGGDELLTNAIGFWDVLVEALQDQATDLGIDDEDEEDGEADEGGHKTPFSAAGDPRSLLLPYLERLAGTLLARMAFSREELLALPIDDVDDQAVPDKMSDVRPWIFRLRASGAGSLGPSASGDAGEEGEEDGSDAHAEVTSWTVRKAAGNALEVLGLVYRETLLSVTLPQLHARLALQGDAPEQWLAREVGVVAVGQLWRGCDRGMAEHMPVLFPYLLATLGDRRPLIRQAACYSLGRAIDWVLEMEAVMTAEGDTGAPPPLQQLVAGFVARLLDHTKSVQQAALAAICEVAEASQEYLQPYIDTLLAAYVSGLERYQLRSRVLLYDAVEVTFNSMGSAADVPLATSHLLPHLVSRATSLPLDDPELVCVMDALADVAVVVGSAIAPAAGHLIARCLALTERDVVAAAADAEAQAASGQHVSPDSVAASGRELARAGLNAVSGIIDAVGEPLGPLLASSNLLDVLYACIRRGSNMPSLVGQAALAAIGDLAVHFPALLQAHIDSLLPAMLHWAVPRPSALNACNNAMWAMGEVALRFGPGIAPYAEQIVRAAAPILEYSHHSVGLLSNTAATLSRVALAQPQTVGALLGSINGLARNWAMATSLVSTPAERRDAYLGLCAGVMANPAAAAPHWNILAVTFAEYKNPPTDTPPDEVRGAVAAVVGAYRHTTPPEVWARIVQGMHPDLVTAITMKYGAVLTG